MHKIGLRIKGVRLDDNPQEFIEELRSVQSVGFNCIELLPDDFDLIQYGSLDIASAKKLHSVIAPFGFAVSVHVPLQLNLMNRECPGGHQNVLNACLELCCVLESDILVFHPGRIVDNVEFLRYGKPEQYWHLLTDFLHKENKILQDLADQYPEITIAIENYRPYADYSPYSHAEFITELLKQVEDIGRENVKMTIDTGHLNLCSSFHGYGIFDYIDEIKDHIVHLHLHDNHGIANFYTEKDKSAMLPFGRGDEHLVPGYGTFPFREFLTRIQPYSGMYMVELTGRYLYRNKIIEAFEKITGLL